MDSQAHRATLWASRSHRRRPPLGGYLRVGGFGSRVALAGPVQLRDQSNVDFRDRFLHLGRLLSAELLGVLARADLAFDLNVRALRKGCCVFAEFSPNDAAMPGRLAL